MKYSSWTGILASLLLIVACFLPWTYHPDLDQTFTGFYSAHNFYGKPGKALVFFAVIAIILFATPRVWAKRTNIMVTVLAITFAIKSYMLFTSCYRGTCPDKKIGVMLILVAPVIMILAAVLPDMKLKEQKK